MQATLWTDEEQEVVDAIERCEPPAPNVKLRYAVTDCFICGKVTIRRVGAMGGEGTNVVPCPECSKPVQAIVVGQLPELSDPDAKSLGAFARDSETSRAAALAAYPRQGTDRRKILHLLDLARKSPAVTGGGHTRDEIAKHTGLSPNTVRPRVKELVDGGWVEPLRDRRGRQIRRSSAAGRLSDVLTLSEQAIEAIRREGEDRRRARFDAGG